MKQFSVYFDTKEIQLLHVKDTQTAIKQMREIIDQKNQDSVSISVKVLHRENIKFTILGNCKYYKNSKLDISTSNYRFVH